MNICPCLISGTSIGAIIGAFYASGMSPKEIREIVDELIATQQNNFKDVLLRKDFIKLIDPNFSRGGLIKGERFVGFLYENMRASAFQELEIPLKVVATDFWRKEEVIIESGPLLPALRASIALPWLFVPVVSNNRILVDGGVVNPLPYDLLRGKCDLIIAVDVLGNGAEATEENPSLFDAVFNTYQIMEQAIVTEKIKRQPPTIYIEPKIEGIRMFDFHKAHEIYKQAGPIKSQLKSELKRKLEEKSKVKHR